MSFCTDLCAWDEEGVVSSYLEDWWELVSLHLHDDSHIAGAFTTSIIHQVYIELITAFLPVIQSLLHHYTT